MAAFETYRVAFPVASGDIDMLDHASNIAFVRWIQDVALAHSAHVGLDFDAYQRLGAVFVVVRHEIDYVRPALRGELLEARTWISSVKMVQCVRATEIARPSDGQLLARALTTWGFIEMATGRPRRIPGDVRAAFAPFIDPSGDARNLAALDLRGRADPKDEGAGTPGGPV